MAAINAYSLLTTPGSSPAGGSSSGLAVDVKSLAALKARAGADPKGAIRESAKQFETLFMNEVVKGMRASVPSSSESDTPGAAFGTEMLDQQYASKLGGMKGGLSEIIMRQLERQMGLTPGPIPSAGTANNTAEPLATQPQATRIPQTGAAGFVQQHADAAREAEASTGIPATFMVSQAALETGWGRKEIKHADGTPSFNLFGIKASGNWKGPVAEVKTTEFVAGQPQRVTAKFRAYSSYAESFADYARLMKSNPRYAGVVANSVSGSGSAAGFAQGLQKAGYATDPEYADKLAKVINTTLRLQRAVA